MIYTARSNKSMGQINKCIEVLKGGGIVIFPTDTAYGIGCRMDDEKAIERLIRIRKRPDGKAFPVLVADLNMAQQYLEAVPDRARKELADKYWPGGLTIVLNCIVERVPDKVRGGGSSLGVRAPKNENLLWIISEVGVPILGPSANFAGGKTPFSIKDIDEKLLKSVDFVLEGDKEINSSSLASTVINCTSEPWKILRYGAVRL